MPAHSPTCPRAPWRCAARRVARGPHPAPRARRHPLPRRQRRRVRHRHRGRPHGRRAPPPRRQHHRGRLAGLRVSGASPHRSARLRAAGQRRRAGRHTPRGAVPVDGEVRGAEPGRAHRPRPQAARGPGAGGGAWCHRAHDVGPGAARSRRAAVGDGAARDPRRRRPQRRGRRHRSGRLRRAGRASRARRPALATHLFNGMPPMLSASPGRSRQPCRPPDAARPWWRSSPTACTLTVAPYRCSSTPWARAGRPGERLHGGGRPARRRLHPGGLSVTVQGRDVRLSDSGSLAGGVSCLLDQVRWCVTELGSPSPTPCMPRRQPRLAPSPWPVWGHWRRATAPTSSSSTTPWRSGRSCAAAPGSDTRRRSDTRRGGEPATLTTTALFGV